jgi:hypothetical protein
VTRHLSTACFDADDLAEVRALLDETVELLANALDALIVPKISELGTVPSKNELVLRRVAIFAVSCFLVEFKCGVRGAETTG